MAKYEKNFSTTSINTGARQGRSYLEDGTYAIDITPPGSKRDGANPEELFALGYSACFHGALDGVKGKEGLDNKSVVKQTVSLLQVPDELDFKLQVDIEVGIEGLDDAEAKKLADKAHEVCPYSRAIKNGHVDVTVNVIPYEEPKEP